MTALDETDGRRSKSLGGFGEGHPDFPIQNLPLGIFSPPNGEPRGGVAIGEMILDLRAAGEAGLFSGAARLAAEVAAGPALNPLMRLGKEPRIALRKRLSELLSTDGTERKAVERLSDKLLHNSADCELHLPASIGNYTDFFAGIYHANNASRLFGLLLTPNYKHIPIAYHGRASSVRPSGTAIRRPNGQHLMEIGDPPRFGPSQALALELEFCAWNGPGNELGI